MVNNPTPAGAGWQRPGRRRGGDASGAPPHRSIWSLRLPRRRLALGVLVALVCTSLLLAVKGSIEAFWGWQLLAWMKALALPGQFLPPVSDDHAWLALAVPSIDLRPPDVGPRGLLVHVAVLAALWWLAGRWPDAARPAAYLQRLVVLVHGSAVLFFLFWPASFPHSPSHHVAGGLRQTWALMLLTPWMHLGTYYLFPFAWWQRVALTALTLLFLLLLAPLQYASHAALIALLGPVAMPVLYLLGGVMLPIMGLVALYGWGMSWPVPAPKRRASP